MKGQLDLSGMPGAAGPISSSGTTVRVPARAQNEAIRQLLAGDEAFALTVLLLAIDRWPPNPEEKHQGCLEWTQRTLKMEFDQEFGANVSDGNINRLMAAISIITTDRFFQDASTFNTFCNMLAREDHDPSIFEPAGAAECAWGIAEALLLSPPDEETPEPFSEDVRRTVGQALEDEGFVAAPDVLRIALGVKPEGTIATDWADDPEMFAGIFSNQQGKSEEVNVVIRDCLAELQQQLRILPLERGSTAEFDKRIAGMLKGTAAKSEETLPNGEL